EVAHPQSQFQPLLPFHAPPHLPPLPPPTQAAPAARPATDALPLRYARAVAPPFPAPDRPHRRRLSPPRASPQAPSARSSPRRRLRPTHGSGSPPSLCFSSTPPITSSDTFRSKLALPLSHCSPPSAPSIALVPGGAFVTDARARP
ncbi:hypothetical protein B1218_36070, partial [Pseudomonas ogarae]